METRQPTILEQIAASGGIKAISGNEILTPDTMAQDALRIVQNGGVDQTPNGAANGNGAAHENGDGANQNGAAVSEP